MNTRYGHVVAMIFAALLLSGCRIECAQKKGPGLQGYVSVEDAFKGVNKSDKNFWELSQELTKQGEKLLAVHLQNWEKKDIIALATTIVKLILTTRDIPAKEQQAIRQALNYLEAAVENYFPRNKEALSSMGAHGDTKNHLFLGTDKTLESLRVLEKDKPNTKRIKLLLRRLIRKAYAEIESLRYLLEATSVERAWKTVKKADANLDTLKEELAEQAAWLTKNNEWAQWPIIDLSKTIIKIIILAKNISAKDQQAFREALNYLEDSVTPGLLQVNGRQKDGKTVYRARDKLLQALKVTSADMEIKNILRELVSMRKTPSEVPSFPPKEGAFSK